MSDFDPAEIVPSTRDLFQVIGTRKRSLAIVARIDDDADREAARLHELNVSAFAFEDAGPMMQLAARSTKTVPSLTLAKVTAKDQCLRARYFGADGVAVDASLDPDEWDKLAKQAKTTRMAALAWANDAATVKLAIAAGARAILVSTASASDLLDAIREAPSSITIVAAITDASADDVRALTSKADACVVPPSLHRSREFAALVAEVDP